MFRIARSPASSMMPPASADHEGQDMVFLQQYCASDHWFGDLDKGVFRLGKVGAQHHGLSTEDCGLLTLIRTYDPDDRVHILQLLERASSHPSRFCFTTHVRLDDGRQQPVICMGESSGFSDTGNGNLMGMFLFPRFTIAPGEAG